MAEYLLPDVGEGLTEAEIVSWKVKVGDTVAINDIVCEIETAKSIVELPSPYAGVVSAILAPEGETIPVGTPIIAIGADAPAAGPAAPAPDMVIDLSNPAASGSGEGESLVGSPVGGAGGAGVIDEVVCSSPPRFRAITMPPTATSNATAAATMPMITALLFFFGCRPGWYPPGPWGPYPPGPCW